MAVFGIQKGDFSYPKSGIIRFGSDFGSQDFVVPMAKFTFFDAKGVPLGSNAPVIYIRLGGTFNTQLSNGYQDATGIMGDPGGTSIFASDTAKAIGRLGGSFIEGIQKQIVQGVAGATGYVASAGQSGKAQVEFLQRVMLNNFQQLIYQGPTFRRFQLPFIMKPHDKTEAETMLDIISSFRVASSPRAGEAGTIADTVSNLGGLKDTDRLLNSAEPGPDPADTTKYAKGEEDPLYQQALQNYNNRKAILDTTEQEAAATIVANSGQVFTFGYPDMCKFDLVLYKANELTTIFKSEFCMIETVSVDYGAQNKMTFFDNKNVKDNKYYPTDVNLTISLREAVLITATKAYQQYDQNSVIL
jgi:hypothetical protein